MDAKTLEMPPMSSDEFAMLGGDQIAYVREMDAEEAGELFPVAKSLPPETRVFALYAANGTPIMLSDSRESVMSNAFENSLSPVSVH